MSPFSLRMVARISLARRLPRSRLRRESASAARRMNLVAHRHSARSRRKPGPSACVPLFLFQPLAFSLTGDADLRFVRGVHADVASTVADADSGIGGTGFGATSKSNSNLSPSPPSRLRPVGCCLP